MGTRKLNARELKLTTSLLKRIREKLDKLSGGDPELLFALRRKIYKELTYDERGKPQYRKKLKKQKFAEQDGKCALCGENLPERYSVLDRFRAVAGYTAENTRLIHADCDIEAQAKKGYS